MDASRAARIFHDWAFSEGLLADGPLAEVNSKDEEFALLQPLTDVGKQILRVKQVQTIAFNPSRSEIIVFTRRAAPTTKRQLGALPAEIDGISIKYRQGVQNSIGPLPSMAHGGSPYALRVLPSGSHYTCGSSISVGNNREAGTLGALVLAGDGGVYGLSNNHVSASCSFASVGMPILAPGVLDVASGGVSPFTIGYHTAALRLTPGSADNVDPKTNLDAAIFRIADPNIVSSFQGNAYDTPAVVGDMASGLSVEKVGRTTGHTRGIVLGQIYGAHPIFYSAPLYGFSGAISFDPVFAIAGEGDLFSDAGDSGSLITATGENGQRVAVGIVIGGMNDNVSAGGKITIALPIEPILSTLGVRLISGHNV